MTEGIFIKMMTFVVVVLLLILVIALVGVYVNFRKDRATPNSEKDNEDTGSKDNETVSEEETNTEKGTSILEDTQQRVINTLRWLNCDWKEVADDPFAIRFSYQAENFVLRFNDVNCFVRVTDPSWYGFSDEDIDMLSKVREVINELNWNSGMTVYYSHDEEEKMFLVHSQHSLVVTEGIDLDEYLVTILRSLFLTQHQFHRLLAEKNGKN